MRRRKRQVMTSVRRQSGNFNYPIGAQRLPPPSSTSSAWMHRTALASWQEKKPAWIKRDHFVNQLHAIIDLRKRKISRERAAHLIPIGDDKVGNEKGSRFVKQLHLITDDDSVVDTSIREYIRCNIEKARLSAEGNITDRRLGGL